MILVPAAVLALLVLASIAVDSAAVFLGQRQLAQAAATAATDAAGAISESTFYQSGAIALDPAEAQRLAAASVAAQNLHGVTLTGAVRVIVVGRQVCISMSGQVPLIFGRALPGVPKAIGVHATAVATAVGDHGATVPSSAIC
jgi:Flp pilus assembly protein TadG